MGNNLSFTWQSIVAAQHIVREGIKWRVGNGNSIRIWGDKWLPSTSTHKVASSRLFLHLDTLVGELIDHENVWWKTEALAALFLPYEVDIIQSIPLSPCFLEDKIVWAKTLNGKFSVRSAYVVATRLSSDPNSGTSSDMGPSRQFWKRLLALPLPHKTRHFAWQACRDILPSKVNLLKCKAVQDSLCDRCRMEVETTGHTFISCSKAREVWACSKIVLPGGAFSMTSFYDLMWRMVMVDQVDVDMVARVVLLAWAMWHYRNEVRMGAQKKPSNVLVSWAASYLEEYSAATVAQTNLEPIIQRAMTWSPPPRCLFKINVDGAIDKANGKAGVVRLSETNWVGWRLQCAKTWMHPWVPLKLNPRLLRQGCCSH